MISTDLSSRPSSEDSTTRDDACYPFGIGPEALLEPEIPVTKEDEDDALDRNVRIEASDFTMSDKVVCSATGGPCSWKVEEWYDDEGNLDSWDEYCENCNQWRDWSKESGPKPDTHRNHR